MCMGIDKPDAEFVIHFDLPGSMENYYQQIERAGRDGLETLCCMYFTYSDRNFHLLNSAVLEDEMERKFKYLNLQVVTELCIQSFICRHKFILNYFGETFESCRDHCDLCITKKCDADRKNRTDEAKDVIACFSDIRKSCITVTTPLLLQTLLGSKSAEIRKKKLDNLPSYGKAKNFRDCSARERKFMATKLLFTLLTMGILEEKLTKIDDEKISDWKGDVGTWRHKKLNKR